MYISVWHDTPEMFQFDVAWRDFVFQLFQLFQRLRRRAFTSGGKGSGFCFGT